MLKHFTDITDPASRVSSADERVAPCRAACPAHVDVPSYLSLAALGRFSEALAVVLDRNPLVAVCGRVCAHPCESSCRRQKIDEPLAIAAVKRAVAEYGDHPSVESPVTRIHKIAVVGAGPAGLTAAYDLARWGYKVTVYEARSHAGGMLRYGIPPYRLPNDQVDRDADHVLSVPGVEFVTDTRVGVDVSLEDLRSRFDAVLLAPGLQVARTLPIPGNELPGVLGSLVFLESVNDGEPMGLGRRVVVVGGGNVAMDAARSAMRSGAESVTLVCLEKREEMPADDHEVDDAEKEGVVLRCGWSPRAILGSERAEGLQAIRCVSVFDEQGRFAPVTDESDVLAVDADTVLLAIGQAAVLTGLDVEASPRGLLAADGHTSVTSLENVFAAGDALSGPARVVDAVASAHKAAAAIHASLSGDASLLVEEHCEPAALGEMPDGTAVKLCIAGRTAGAQASCGPEPSFDEIELGYSQEQAVREAGRCLSCTGGARLDSSKCATCLNCVRVCPYGVPRAGAHGFPEFPQEECRACGACAAECPARAIRLEGTPDDALRAGVMSALAESTEAIAFACGCVAAGFSSPGERERTVVVPCLLRVSDAAVLTAIEHGADQVVFESCSTDVCPYRDASELVHARLRRVSRMAADLGLADRVVVMEAPVEIGGQV